MSILPSTPRPAPAAVPRPHPPAVRPARGGGWER
eukprot:gene10493-biopygen12321